MRFCLTAALTAGALGIGPVDKWEVTQADPRGGAQHIRIHAHTRWLWVDEEPFGPCSEMAYNESQIIQDALFWPYSGLKDLQERVVAAYESGGHPRERRYRAKTGSYGGKAGDSIATNYTQLLQCTADSMDDIVGSPYTALCTCLQRGDAKQACSWTGALAVNTHCLDQMKKARNISDQCPSLTSSNYGVPLSSKCTGWVAGSVSALDLSLHQANYPSGTPQAITAGIADKELRTYYLLQKSLERFIRFTEGYELCTDPVDTDNITSLNIDFVPLDTWKVEKMWWLDNGKNNDSPIKSKLPFAVLASRTGCDVTQCPNANSLLVLVRDARNSYEAKVQGTYEAGRQLNAREHGVIVHAGYDMLAQQISPGLGVFLESWLAAKPRPDAKITYAGYGWLGSGVASVLAHDVANKYAQSPQGTAVQHNLVTFESGRVGNYAFNLRLANAVNVRNVAGATSAMAEFPCEGPRSCDRENIAQTGDADGTVIGQFLPLPGRVEPRPAMNIAPLNLVAEATCSTSCWLTFEACSDDLNHSRCEASSGCVALQ